MSATRRRYSSRKFLSTMGWGLVWTGMVIAGKLGEAIYETLMTASVIGYLVADVSEKKFVAPEAR